ncbi:hypothetical protein GFL18_07360 [Rhizobium leguminosarum bv. viciae]|nr:hypothetical protein [Rhizobium leguminosarum bv. viciae]
MCHGKTGWMRVEAAGDTGRWWQQAILGRGHWDAAAAPLVTQLSQINPLISIHLHARTAMLPSPASWGIAYDN